MWSSSSLAAAEPTWWPRCATSTSYTDSRISVTVASALLPAAGDASQAATTSGASAASIRPVRWLQVSKSHGAAKQS
jgi:hypothetical protein